MDAKLKVKFMCTGMCGETHPIHDHCPCCHHAEFKATVPYRRGKADVYHNMLHGPSFVIEGKHGYPPEKSKLWKAWEEVMDFGIRNCAYWFKRTEKKKGGE